jgi:MoaA/NifB/PqqE/SkfB family radical SAM enzyme
MPFHRDARAMAPVHVRIKPMNHCNQGCWFCAYRADGLDLGDEMNLQSRIPEPKMFEIAADLGHMGVRAVTFSGGGEPLLYKKLPETIEALARGGVRTAAITNGSNLKGRIADALAEHGSWVRVSIDAGNDETYCRTRNLKPETRPFSCLLENLAAFARRRSRCTLGVSFIIHEGSAGQIVEACRQFKAAGVSHVKLSGVIVGNDVAANKAYHDRIVARATEQIAQAMDLASSEFSVVNHYHGLSDNFIKPYRTCPMLRFLTVIGADCSVYTCQDKAYTERGRLGSIRDRSFAEFWFSAENQRALDEIDPAASCQHHCAAHRKNLLLSDFAALDRDHLAFV